MFQVFEERRDVVLEVAPARNQSLGYEALAVGWYILERGDSVIEARILTNVPKKSEVRGGNFLKQRVVDVNLVLVGKTKCFKAHFNYFVHKFAIVI